MNGLFPQWCGRCELSENMAISKGHENRGRCGAPTIGWKKEHSMVDGWILKCTPGLPVWDRNC